jgi:peptidoglycan/LPS O-acetylase OafA/YrhL
VIARYHGLDAWRGLAALAVVCFHMTGPLVPLHHALWSDVLLSGWAGVFVFFPISGYCILAAVHIRGEISPRSFLVRRWWRIFPTYWASVLLTLLIALIALPWNHGSLASMRLSPALWLGVATLTQNFFGQGGVVNPVYWSLGFEEQFYVIVALSLLLGANTRRALFLVLGVAAVCYLRLPEPRIPGLFLEYWLHFLAGAGAFMWQESPSGRWWALLTWCICAAGLWPSWSIHLMISLGAAVLMCLARPLDRFWIRTRAGRVLISLGTISYSLYLVHVPIGGRVMNILKRLQPRSDAALAACVAVGALASLVAAVLFHRWVERRFKRPSSAG